MQLSDSKHSVFDIMNIRNYSQEKQIMRKENNQNLFEIPPKYLWKTMDNDFVKEFRNNKIYYTKDFYIAMHKEIEAGKTYVEAYESLGFNIKETGIERANAAGKRAEKMAKEGKLNTAEVSSYDGSVPLEKMKHLNDQEKLAYLQARVIYLEAAAEIKKKFLQELAASSSISKSNTQKK